MSVEFQKYNSCIKTLIPSTQLCFSSFCIVIIFLLSCSISTAQIVRIENDQALTDTNKLSGAIDLNFYTVKNNSQFFKLATGSQVKYSKNKNTLLSINELRIIFSGQNDLENRGFQHLRYQKTLDSTFTWEVFSQIQFDQVLKIKLRQLNGTGVRMQFFRKSKSKLFLGLHYMYEYEEEYETDIINNDHRISSQFSFSKKLPKSFVHCIAYYQPKIADFSDYRVSGSATFTIELSKQLRFNIRGELNYDSQPVIGINSLTYTFLNGFSWGF